MRSVGGVAGCSHPFKTKRKKRRKRKRRKKMEKWLGRRGGRAWAGGQWGPTFSGPRRTSASLGYVVRTSIATEVENRLYVRWLSTPVIKYGASKGSQHARASAFEHGVRTTALFWSFPSPPLPPSSPPSPPPESSPSPIATFLFSRATVRKRAFERCRFREI